MNGIMFPDSISLNFTVTIDPEMERPAGLADHKDFLKVSYIVWYQDYDFVPNNKLICI